MKAQVLEHLELTKQASKQLAGVSEDLRKQILQSLAKSLRDNCNQIIAANQKDLLQMDNKDPKYDRLLLNEDRINAMADDVAMVAALPQPSGVIEQEIIRPNGLKIQKLVTPIGVVAVIYESRPNVTVDVFCLCFKTANACILKGGKEAQHSNKCLTEIIQDVVHAYGLNRNCIYLMPPQHELIQVVLNAHEYVDVCIPRGSQTLINFVREHASIPVIETGAGIVHTYFDKSGDLGSGRLIINNAKTRRVSVCNALDTLLIHQERLADLPSLVALLAEKNVVLLADEASFNVLKSSYPQELLLVADEEDYGIEFLDYKMSIKTVASVEEAVTHITHYTSGHSEAIIATDKTAIEYFVQNVDAAAVYVNASTAFTDGGQFGMGAEIGISTQKIHARGPMGLEALTSYKWVVLGSGQIRE
ncbi:MAG: glutamate-5-semialdehyde dehydrogenase [Legionella sp.]|jgi:glutamate-5-semialdehyde dehydrogenase